MIKEPIIFEIANKTWCINEFGMDAMFLLEGNQFALLIDTGTGVFDLKKYIQQLTDKPLIVALTHGHVDHAGGIGQFDTIYLHQEDEQMALDISVDDRKDYTNIMMNMCQGVYEINEDSVIDFNHTPQIKYLKDGNRINLGDRDIYVYHTPGHTDGGLTFLDIQQRIIFSGDACNPNILLCVKDGKYTDISHVLESAKTIQALESHYDRHYNGHVGYGDSLIMNALPVTLVQDVIDLCNYILEAKAEMIEVDNPFGGKCLLSRNKTMQIQYRKEQVK